MKKFDSLKAMVAAVCLACMVVGCAPVNKVAGLIESIRDRSASGQRVWAEYLNSLCQQSVQDVSFKKNDKYNVNISCANNSVYIRGYVEQVPQFTSSLFVRNADEKRFNRFLRYLKVRDRDLFWASCSRESGRCRVEHGVDALGHVFTK